MTHPKLPARRPLEIAPFRHENNEPGFALIDRLGIAPDSLSLTLFGYLVFAHLDGAHTCAEIQAFFQQRCGQNVPAEKILELVHALDQAFLLDTERFAQAYHDRRRAYADAPARDNCRRWPPPAQLRAEIETLLSAGAAARPRALRGLIAPHLDYQRGAPCYAAAYTTLALDLSAERYVILGTNHFGGATSVVATRKDFQTPLGRVPADRTFLSKIETRLGQSICEHEFDHLNEHSVELQVHVLQMLHAERPFEIVPVLCPDPSGPMGTAPCDGRGPDLGDFADALGELVRTTDKPTVLIAGADLSHVGQHFGEAETTTPEFLRQVAKSDQDLLALLEARREDDFVATVRAAQNATRICSVGCIYALLRALPNEPCTVLRYHQATNFEAETHVTCAAALIGS